MGPVFSPLDERCQLLPSQFSPFVMQAIVWLGTIVPFERVPALLQFFTGVYVSAETARRLTEEAGKAQVAVEQTLLDRVRHDLPPIPPGPEVQQLSADGAMVPLVHGEWAEVRTLVTGTMHQGHAHDLWYFSRLCSAHDFIDWVALPLHLRGTARAGTVIAVTDGADWLQQLVDAHAPDAVRILDFPHAVEYLSAAAQAAFGSGTVAATTWLETWRHELKHGHPDMVLAAVRALPTVTPEATAVRDRALAYLHKRRQQIAYAAFRAQGYPIGSGAIESANKLVVEARLKGSGMHWTRENVTPMVALRAIACTDRWDDVWPALWTQLRRQVADRRRRGRARRRASTATLTRPPDDARIIAIPRPRRPPRIVDGHPTAAHPWSHGYDPVRLARFHAKT